MLPAATEPVGAIPAKHAFTSSRSVASMDVIVLHWHLSGEPAIIHVRPRRRHR